MAPKKVVIMTTGTQGEPTSILRRLSEGRNRQFDIQTNDTVVLSSNPIPGNEEGVHRTINRLLQRGARVIYDPSAQVHVSGHASAEEMKLLIHLVKPKHVVPIHGELRHLTRHAAIAREVGIPLKTRPWWRMAPSSNSWMERCRWRARARRLCLRGRHGRRRYRA